jgi:uncharacterized protein YndB with AHSA1/START domain
LHLFPEQLLDIKVFMANIIHRIGIKASADRVYRALSTIEGLAGWWTVNVDGNENVGGKINFTFRELSGEVKGIMGMEVKELIPGKQVNWICREGPPEWIGTEISYQLDEADGQTILLFHHNNWREEVEFMGHCSMKWAVFLLSLREYVETSKGRPHPKDLKIDNWN